MGETIVVLHKHRRPLLATIFAKLGLRACGPLVLRRNMLRSKSCSKMQHFWREARVSEEGSSRAGRKAGKGGDERIVIKKYANRRLYNTGSSSYVTLENLAEMVKEGVDFVVYDAKTNDDITRQVLTQIIFEEENADGAQNLLPIQFLRQLIRFYGDQMSSFVPSYLEMSLDAFARQQERMREQMSGTFGAAPGFGLFDEQIRQNMALFDRAMKMFAPPFAAAAGGAAKTADTAPDAPAASAAGGDQIADLKNQLEAMQKQIEKLAGGKG
jgi:polyhydroxyalkanoate synthesis repressor PhaR